MTRLVVLLSKIIAKSHDEGWSDLRESLSLYPMYKWVLVRISDGDRTDWDHNPYDEATYALEHEPLPDNIARLDIPSLVSRTKFG